MKNCKHCGAEVAKSAKVCPKCGGRLKMPVFLRIIIVLVVLGIIVGVAGGKGASTEPFKHEVTKSYQDAFSYYIEGTVTNNTDKDYSYVQIEFICYDKAGNNLGTAFDNTNNLLGKQTWKYKAMGLFTDKTVDHCDFHEVTGW